MQYYDSLPSDTEMVTHLFKKLQKLFSANSVLNGYRVPSEMTTSIVSDTPQQSNSYDCGLFVCQTMRALVLGLRLNFRESMMPQIRANMVEPFKKYLESSKVRQAMTSKDIIMQIV
jgi:Ulp1 family protease